jgi:hypothetical protein
MEGTAGAYSSILKTGSEVIFSGYAEKNTALVHTTQYAQLVDSVTA